MYADAVPVRTYDFRVNEHVTTTTRSRPTLAPHHATIKSCSPDRIEPLEVVVEYDGSSDRTDPLKVLVEYGIENCSSTMPDNGASSVITGVDHTTSMTNNPHPSSPLHQHEIPLTFSSRYDGLDEVSRATSRKKVALQNPIVMGRFFKKEEKPEAVGSAQEYQRCG
jgi:hypothetical protein